MDWKRLGKRILFPRTALIWIIWPAAAALLIYSAIALESTDTLSVISYVLSFYSLAVIALRVPDIIKSIRGFKQNNPYAIRFASDIRFRMNITLYSAFLFNAGYAFFQLSLGLKHHSVWFYSMAAYYTLLALMRLMLVRHTRQSAPGTQQMIEWRKYRLCGVCLMLITLALTVFVLYFILKIRIFRHHEITTIAMACYSFTSFSLAIRNAIRYRSYGSPVYSAAKAISLASAIVSMLTLENAMLTAFGQSTDELFHQIMLSSSGAAVILSVLGIALYMIINSSRKMRQLH